MYAIRSYYGQEAIYYISGEDMETVTRSPQLEGFRKRGVEVLLLNPAVDLMTSAMRLDHLLSVITSYSIHYTKLYEPTITSSSPSVPGS